eukprot:TRINITY_DN10969_c0_g1_i1.p2 TRINITY_DN10969_c0_g1~~TRINITY_DN10969_c0_g1_i1.p2  ORF type:complete len:74 (-),score=0.39 TRINITY_DN10969_c0_g1_i1:218-439(-)
MKRTAAARREIIAKVPSVFFSTVRLSNVMEMLSAFFHIPTSVADNHASPKKMSQSEILSYAANAKHVGQYGVP